MTDLNKIKEEFLMQKYEKIKTEPCGFFVYFAKEYTDLFENFKVFMEQNESRRCDRGIYPICEMLSLIGKLHAIMKSFENKFDRVMEFDEFTKANASVKRASKLLEEMIDDLNR